MKTAALSIGMSVRHPSYGIGTVKAITEHSVDVAFNDMKRTVHAETSGLEPAEAQAEVSGLTLPLQTLLRQVVDATIDRLGIEKPDSSVHELAPRWRAGKLVLHPADPALATKEVEIELFFHKIVMMRNNLRVLEQKINGSETLSTADKFDWQQYITRCYGSMTTFNLLFKDKESQF
jgi:hypothetical protein